MSVLRLSLLLLFLLSPFAVSAVEVRGLYEAEVPVADRGTEARAQALTAALREVMVKVGGLGGIEPEADAARYVQQFQYRADTVPGPDGTAMERLLLWARFDPEGVNRALRERGLVPWGSARPLTLVWLAIEQGGRRQMVGATDEGLAREFVETAGRRRALPVRLPLLDLEDRAGLQPADVWGDFGQAIAQASARYQPQATLVGRAYPFTGELWEAQWTLYHDDVVQRWAVQSRDIGFLIGSGLEGAADRLSRTLAQTAPDTDDRVRLAVAGLSDLTRYRRVMDYLSTLHGVSDLMVDQVLADRAEFRMRVEGGGAKLVKILALGDTLAPLPAAPDDGGGLAYRLVP